MRAVDPQAILIEGPTPFSRSLLWQFQRDYFTSQGMAAYREVPHYITNTAILARTWASIVHRLVCERDRRSPRDGPVTILELGAGCGRFAHRFLDAWLNLQSGDPGRHPAIRYCCSDFCTESLSALAAHPWLQRHLDSGILDLAFFDMSASREILSTRNRPPITEGDLDSPLVVIANYVFDSVPQDWYYLADGSCYAVNLSLAVDREPSEITTAEMMRHLGYQLSLDAEPMGPRAPQHLTPYSNDLDQVWLGYPVQALRCLKRLRRLSQEGLLLLLADKGPMTMEELRKEGPPDFELHGSISLPVNLHAIADRVHRLGGDAIFSKDREGDVVVTALGLFERPGEYESTWAECRRLIEPFRADPFGLTEVRPTDHDSETMLSMLADSHYDERLLGRLLPRFRELQDRLSAEQRGRLHAALERAWAGCLPIRGQGDLALRIANLLYAMGDLEKARGFYAESLTWETPTTSTVFNLGLCCHALGDYEIARALFEEVREAEPGNRGAVSMLGRLDDGERDPSHPAPGA